MSVAEVNPFSDDSMLASVRKQLKVDRFSDNRLKIPNPSRKYVDKISFRSRYQRIDFVLSLLSKTALF